MSDVFTFSTSTVADGNMSERFDMPERVHTNRTQFLSRVGARDRALAVMHVNHGDSSVALTKDMVTAAPIEAEALMANDSTIALFLLTADCLPVAYMDRAHGAFALAHLGWRPATKGLARRVVRAMSDAYGTCADELSVIIGPGIGVDSYAMDTVEQQDDAWAPYTQRRASGRIHIDLKGFVCSQLIECGVPETAITVHPSDTCADQTYFSHYRSRTLDSPEGRMASVLFAH
jgi:YfiH family protein